jgi:hypothetical protein
MATNLVSLVMQFLTPDMVGRSASSTPKTARGYGADRQDWWRSRAVNRGAAEGYCRGDQPADAGCQSSVR